ncbi:MAG: GTPase Era [Candidatus Binatia bacterium]
MTASAHRAGHVAIVGRPNVGKSTLLNGFVGVKLAAVSPKPQTTRTRIVGLRTLPGAQVAFLDTPGIHAARSVLNRRMVEAAQRSLAEADVVLLVLDATAGVTPQDRELAARLGETTVVVALNKIDRVAKGRLLPQLEAIGQLLPGREIVPVSAAKGDGVGILLEAIVRALPNGPALYPADEYTTESARFLVQEMVHEQLFLALDQEVPYGTAVLIDDYVEEPERELTTIRATILVERAAHKAMVIGKAGGRLKEVGTRARLALETLLGTRVFLDLFVRVEPGWSRNPRRLAELGL